MEIVPLEGGRYEERPAPKQLPGNQVTLLSPRGSLFFAGAAEFEGDLPEIGSAERPVVLLRLRGRDEIGSTFQRVLTRYAANLKANQGKLVLAGVSEHVYNQLQKTGLLEALGKENVYKATSIMGDSALNAYADANAWLAKSVSEANPSKENGG
jgi:SulP family sulfate permease